MGNRIQKQVDASSYLKELKSGSYDYFYDNDNRLVEEVYQKASPGWGNSWGSCFSWQNKKHGVGHGKIHEEVTNYLYDLNGNLLEQKQGRDVSKFSYDASDNMIMAEVPGKKPVAFTFNGDGQRIARFFRDKGYHHGWSRGRSDDDDSESAQWWRKKPKPKWKLDTSFLYNGPEVLAEFDSKGKLNTSYTAGPGIDNLISLTQHNGRGRSKSYFYAADALGSVRQIMDSRGTSVNSYNYSPYGVAYDVRELVKQPYRYTGRRWDPNVGKLWYRSRHYAPGIGRFATADKYRRSITNPIVNLSFVYAKNNPMFWIDPFGYASVKDFIEVAYDTYETKKATDEFCKRVFVSDSTRAEMHSIAALVEYNSISPEDEAAMLSDLTPSDLVMREKIIETTNLDTILYSKQKMELVKKVSSKFNVGDFTAIMWLSDVTPYEKDGMWPGEKELWSAQRADYNTREIGGDSFAAPFVKEYNFYDMVLNSERAKTHDMLTTDLVSAATTLLPYKASVVVEVIKYIYNK